MGLLMGLWEIHDLQLHGSWVEGNSKVVAGLLLGCLEACPVIHEIIDLILDLNIKLSYIPRSHNGTADKLAK